MGGWVILEDILCRKLGSGKLSDEYLIGELLEWDCCEFEWECVWLLDDVFGVWTLGVVYWVDGVSGVWTLGVSWVCGSGVVLWWESWI